MVKYNFSEKDCKFWIQNKKDYSKDPVKFPLRNPKSNYKIKEGKGVWKQLEFQCEKFNLKPIKVKVKPKFKSRYMEIILPSEIVREIASFEANIFEVIENDDIENFIFLYKKFKRSKTKFIDFKEYEVLKLIIASGAYKILKFLVKKEKLDFNIFSGVESLPFIAVKYEQYNILELMLKNGADPNKKFEYIDDALLGWLPTIDRYRKIRNTSIYKKLEVKDFIEILVESDKYFKLISKYGGKSLLESDSEDDFLTFQSEDFFYMYGKAINDQDFASKLKKDIYDSNDYKLELAKFFLKILPIIDKEYVGIEEFYLPIEFVLEVGSDKLIRDTVNKMYELGFIKGSIFELIAYIIQRDKSGKLLKKVKRVFKNDLILVFSVESFLHLKEKINYAPNIMKYY